MSPEILKRAVALAVRTGTLLVATADAAGLPHLAAAGQVSLRPDGRLEVDHWFCPGTLANLEANSLVSVTAWDPREDEGWQLLGEVEEVFDLAVLDGLAPGQEERPMPQIERRIVVRVDKVLDFTLAPHTDREE